MVLCCFLIFFPVSKVIAYSFLYQLFMLKLYSSSLFSLDELRNGFLSFSFRVEQMSLYQKNSTFQLNETCPNNSIRAVLRGLTVPISLAMILGWGGGGWLSFLATTTMPKILLDPSVATDFDLYSLISQDA